MCAASAVYSSSPTSRLHLYGLETQSSTGSEDAAAAQLTPQSTRNRRAADSTSTAFTRAVCTKVINRVNIAVSQRVPDETLTALGKEIPCRVLVVFIPDGGFANEIARVLNERYRSKEEVLQKVAVNSHANIDVAREVLRKIRDASNCSVIVHCIFTTHTAAAHRARVRDLFAAARWLENFCSFTLSGEL